MSNFIFNIAKGKVNYYAGLPEANDGLIAVPLQTSGIEPDETLKDRLTLASLLTVSAEQTTLGRKNLTGSTSVPDHTSNLAYADVDDFTWVAGSGSAIAAIVICYVPDVGVSADSAIIPLTKHDFSAIPTGSDIPVQVSSSGFFVASEDS